MPGVALLRARWSTVEALHLLRGGLPSRSPVRGWDEWFAVALPADTRASGRQSGSANVGVGETALRGAVDFLCADEARTDSSPSRIRSYSD